MNYHTSALRVEAVSEDITSDSESVISESYLPSQHTYEQPYRPAPVHHTPQLPSFQSWDRDWVSGGVNSSDKAFTNHVGGVRNRQYEWEPASVPSVYGDTYPDPFESPRPASWSEKKKDKRQYNGDGKGGNVSGKEKQKRIGRLEEEFGERDTEELEEEKSHQKRKHQQRKLAVGDVTEKGKVILGGSKKRIGLRWAEGLLILAAVAAGPGIALLIKPDEKPPPSGKLPTIAIYILSAFSLVSFLWFFVLQPCCSSDQKRDQHPHGLSIPMTNGYSSIESSSGCCGGRKKKQKQGQGMSLNLIMDPSMFPHLQQYQNRDLEKAETTSSKHDSRKTRRAAKEENSDSDSDSDTDSTHSAASSFHIPKQVKDDLLEQAILGQQTVAKYSFVNRQAREDARKRLRNLITHDALSILLWFAVSIWAIGFGERCPPGTHQGYCDGYNGLLAIAVFLACSFGLSMVFGIKDLRTLKGSS